jgi:hypothetical protein
MSMVYSICMNEADFDREFNIPEKTINDIVREIVETKAAEND